ncbi:MAG: 2Fe-2S iron-sulfur cluster binding domain-containing protein [Lachnospiraceae bacterium]|nr:2Fe-2S iron-sulfur cluster binding domain-containing protein [Lachnospiraceae bacterium]
MNDKKNAHSEIEIEGRKGESLLSALLRSHICVNAVCGGKGHCGKCRVQVLSEVKEATAADRRFFREDELADGMRLACGYYPEGRCKIRIFSVDEEDFEIVTDVTRNPSPAQNLRDSRYDIAVDIGTTTLAMSLVLCDDAQMIHTVTGVNHQRVCGADVISRIQAANEGHLQELSRCIRKDLFDLILRLLRETGTPISRIRRIAAAGNTTMGHILMGYSCETLGVYPFEPVSLSLTQIHCAELFAAATEDSCVHGGINAAKTVSEDMAGVSE